MSKKNKKNSKKKVVRPRVIKKKTGVKAKKKVWVSIFSSSLFNKVQLGSIPVVDADMLKGRGVKANLSNLTRDLRNQNVTLGFKINKVEEGKAFADPVSYGLSHSSVSRIVKKNISKVDNSFICSTKDDVILRVKPIAVTRFKTTSMKTKALNKILVNLLCSRIKELSFSDLVEGLIRKKFQDEVKKKMSKIYPLKIFDIKSFRIARGKEVERVLVANDDVLKLLERSSEVGAAEVPVNEELSSVTSE